MLFFRSGVVNLQNKTTMSEPKKKKKQWSSWLEINQEVFSVSLLVSWFFGNFSWNCIGNAASSLCVCVQLLGGNPLTLCYNLHGKSHHPVPLFPLLSHSCTSSLPVILLAVSCTHLLYSCPHSFICIALLCTPLYWKPIYIIIFEEPAILNSPCQLCWALYKSPLH